MKQFKKALKRVFAIKPATIMADLRQKLDAQFDYLYYRTGREIILTHDELIDSLYYYLTVLDHSDASKAKKLFNSIIEIKNLAVELKKRETKTKHSCYSASYQWHIETDKRIEQELTSIDPTFIQQWSEAIYQKIVRIQRSHNLYKTKQIK